jgi:hypothetical protein
MTGHRVHIERLPDHGVAIYLDGVRIKSLSSWSITEELRPPSVLTFKIGTDAVIWGAPAPAASVVPVDDGRHHYVWMTADARTTPSGKRACQTCGEAWVCSTAQRRWELYGSTEPPDVTDHEAELLRRIDSARRHIDRLVDSGELAVGGADVLLSILNGPEVDKPSGESLE